MAAGRRSRQTDGHLHGAQVLFKAADSLTHRRLSSTESDRGQRKAVFGDDRDEGLEFSELHRSSKQKGHHPYG
jgi:hypothetical protein